MSLDIPYMDKNIPNAWGMSFRKMGMFVQPIVLEGYDVGDVSSGQQWLEFF